MLLQEAGFIITTASNRKSNNIPQLDNKQLSEAIATVNLKSFDFEFISKEHNDLVLRLETPMLVQMDILVFR